MRARRPAPRRVLAGAVPLLLAVAGGASCGGDDDDGAGPTAPVVTAAAGGGTTTTGATLDVADACALVPLADAEAALGLDLDAGVPAGDARRRVCTFQAVDADVGITVGVEGSGRFEEKAEASRRALGDEGHEVDVGDAALSFFSDDDIPEGVGGTLVAVGEMTVDITLQGLGEEELRRAGVALAAVAVGNL